MKRTLYFLAVLLFIVSCKETPYEPILYGSLEGNVIDSETNMPLEAVSVFTNPPTSAVQTDSKGYYNIESIPTGAYTVTAKKYGYDKENTSVSITEANMTKADLFLNTSENNNAAPSKPVVVNPADASENLPVSLNFIWSAYDEDKNDSLNYDVFLYESNSIEKKKIGEAVSDTVLLVNNLKYSTSYYWYVTVTDEASETSTSDVWSFSTMPMPDNPILFSYHTEEGYDIYSTDNAGNQTVRLTNLPGDEKWPRFSPNKRYIAFTAKGNMTNNIYILDVQNHNGYFLSDLEVAGNHNPGIGFCWSSTGDKIFFPYYNKLFSVNNDGTGLKEIVTAPQDRNFRECDYSPIENKLAVLTIGTDVCDSEIYIVDLADNSMILLVENTSGITERPGFSVDGRSIDYTKDFSGHQSVSGRQLDSHIILLNLNSGIEKDLSLNKTAGTNDTNPRFSANGAEIVYNNSQNNDASEMGIWIMDLDGRNRRKILDNGIMPEWK